MTTFGWQLLDRAVAVGDGCELSHVARMGCIEPRCRWTVAFFSNCRGHSNCLARHVSASQWHCTPALTAPCKTATPYALGRATVAQPAPLPAAADSGVSEVLHRCERLVPWVHAIGLSRHFCSGLTARRNARTAYGRTPFAALDPKTLGCAPTVHGRVRILLASMEQRTRRSLVEFGRSRHGAQDDRQPLAR